MFVKICLFLFVLSSGKTEDCLPRDYGRGGTVCVCNSKHCDTVKPITKPASSEFLVYESNLRGLRLHQTTQSFVDEASKNSIKLSINLNQTYQSILGWGGAYTDSSGININSLSNKTKEHLLRSYFSEDGIEYSLCRVPIGGTDFSTHPYAYDEYPGDMNLTKFNLTDEDYQLKIPLIKEALKLTNGKLRLFASAWSPPAWMKTNNDLSGFGFLLTNCYQTWADYHVKFLEAYKKEGINFWGMTTGNEPINGIIPFRRFNSMGWLPDTQRRWISDNLGPTIRKSEFSDIKLMALDDQRFFLPWWINILLDTQQARDYIDGIAIHWYYDDIIPASVLDLTKKNFPEKFLLMSEACNGDRPWQEKVILGSWKRAEFYIDDIMENLHHWVSGWVDWNFALNLKGGPSWINNLVDAPILVNETSDEFYKQPMFYAIGHFSKFIPAGSIRTDISPEREDILTVALKRPDGGVAIVLYNKSDKDKIPVSIFIEQRGYINVVLETHSIQTILYW